MHGLTEGAVQMYRWLHDCLEKEGMDIRMGAWMYG